MPGDHPIRIPQKLIKLIEHIIFNGKRNIIICSHLKKAGHEIENYHILKKYDSKPVSSHIPEIKSEYKRKGNGKFSTFCKKTFHNI